MQAGQFNDACTRAYYAMFNAARALLVEMHGYTPEQLKRHATVLRQFSVHFVATGAFSADAGRVLRRASDLRIVADYDEAAVQTDRARNTVDAMEKFISAAAAVRMERKP